MRKFTLFIPIILFTQLANAQITFQKAYGTPGIDMGEIIQQTTDGGYIIFGHSDSVVPIDNYDVYLLRIDAYGDTLWTKIIGGPGPEYVIGGQQTSDGGYVISGRAKNFNSGYDDVFLCKTDSSGTPDWTKTFGTAGQHSYGTSVKQTADGGYIITGATSMSGGSMFLIKADGNGDSLWTKLYEGSSPFGRSLCLTSDGGYAITGGENSFNYFGIYLVKSDPFGDTLWTRSYSKYTNSFAPMQTNCVQQTMDGGYICTGGIRDSGSSPSDVLLIKTDSIGNLSWTKKYGGLFDDWGYTVRQTLDGGYIIAGTCNYGSGTNNSDVYLIRTDINGDTLWTRTMGGISDEYGGTVELTSDGGFIITGITASFNGFSWDIYVIKADSNGISGCNQGTFAAIVTSPTFQTGSTFLTTTSPFYIVTSPSLIENSGGTVTSLCTTVNLNEIASDHTISVFPNPTIGNFSVTFSEIITNGTVELYDTLGKIVYYENLDRELNKEINLQNISDGIYFVKVFDGQNSYLTKLIIQHTIK